MTPDPEVVMGEPVSITIEPDIIWLALYQSGTPMWFVSGIHYLSVEALRENLVAFRPTRILAVRVQIPRTTTDARGGSDPTSEGYQGPPLIAAFRICHRCQHRELQHRLVGSASSGRCDHMGCSCAGFVAPTE